MGGKNEGISCSKINLPQREYPGIGSLSLTFYFNVRDLTEPVTDIVKNKACS